jgi:hypothetical protein
VLFDRKKKDVDSEARYFFDKGLTLYVGADAENGGLLLLIGHAGSSCERNDWAFGWTVTNVRLNPLQRD